MDTLQYVYSTSESSDDDSVEAPSRKDTIQTSSSSSKKLNDSVGSYSSTRRKSPPSERRGSSDKRPSSSEPGRGRSQESRSRTSPDSRKDRRSPDRHLADRSRRSWSGSHKSSRRHRDHSDRDRIDKDRRHRDRSRSKDRRRDRSREHRYDRRSRSRSPRRSRRDSPKRKSKDRSRTRSPPHRKPFDAKNKLYILTKMGIDYKGTESVDAPNKSAGVASTAAGSGPSVPQYYNPLTINAGKYAEQIAKRKLLWNNKKAEKEEAAKTSSSIWQGAKFSQDSDGKLTAKFQRLMGIKNQGGDNTDSSGQEIIKKQEELFSSMEMQYEVARATTHTQRGVGLGFGPRHIP